VDLLLNVIMMERDKQLSHFDALDTKAGVLIAFVGVLIGLTHGIPWPYGLPGAVLAAASAFIALSAFWPRGFPFLRPSTLSYYVAHEADYTRLTLHDTIGQMITEGAQLLDDKARKLKWALAALVLATAAFGAGSIITAYQARTTHGVQRQDPTTSRSSVSSRGPTPPASPSAAGRPIPHHLYRARRQP
jgi:hypothetical protein